MIHAIAFIIALIKLILGGWHRRRCYRNSNGTARIDRRRLKARERVRLRWHLGVGRWLDVHFIVALFEAICLVIMKIAQSLLNFDLFAKLFRQIPLVNHYRVGPGHINLRLFGCGRCIRFPVHFLGVHIPVSTVACTEMGG